MATSKKLSGSLSTCSVCFEVFRKPSTLDCGHTFCGQCMVSYSKTRPDAINDKCLLCPFCWKRTKVPYPDQPVEKWAEQLKPIFLLQGFIDSFGSESKDTANCDLCHDEGETTPAAAWCSVCNVSLCNSCFKVHRRIPATRHHDVSDLSGEVKVTRKRNITCHEHKDEYMKFYCKDCRKILCQSCCIVYHRHCKSVTSVESMLPEISATLGARKKDLMKKIQEEEVQLTWEKSLCSNIPHDKSSIQSQIRSTAQKAMDAIKKKEKQLMDELDEITDKQTGQLKEDMKSLSMAIQIHRQEFELIEQAVNSDSEMDMFDKYQSCESPAVCNTNVKDRGNRMKIKFSQNMKRFNKLLDELSLGKLRQDHENINYTSNPVLNAKIYCRTDDANLPELVDVTQMLIGGNDVLIVTDRNNKCVKSFCNRNNQSQLKLEASPRRIAVLEEDKVAITCPESRQIVIVAVTPALSLLCSIKTMKPYIGLAALTSTTMAAGSYSPPCVDILDRSGNVLQSISPLNNGKTIIQNPNFLCTTKEGNILVSDRGTKSVLCLTLQGDVVFNYSPTGDKALESPRGITCTSTGDILVVDSLGDKMIQLNESGQFVRDILTSLDGLSYPFGLHYDERGNFYVTSHCFVHVFTF